MSRLGKAGDGASASGQLLILLLAEVGRKREFRASGVRIRNREVAEARKSGDRLLSREEIAERLHCTVQHISRGWRANRFPFLFKDGARLVGSEDGLERWIKNRVKKSA